MCVCVCVCVCVDIKRRDDLNYKEILSKIKRLLGWWKERDLTIMGKVHLLKTYALYSYPKVGIFRSGKNVLSLFGEVKIV